MYEDDGETIAADSKAAREPQRGGGGSDPGCRYPITPSLSIVRTTGTTVVVGLAASELCHGAVVEVQRQNGSTWVKVGQPGSVPFYITDSNRQPSTTYCYRGVATVGTRSKTSPTVCATTTIVAPAAPLLHRPTVGKREIRLQVSDRSGNEQGFRVYRRVDGETWQLRKTLPAAPGTGDLLEVEETFTTTDQSTYCYLVSAFNAGGSASAPETCTVLRNDHDAPEATRQWSFGGQKPNERDDLWNFEAETCLEYGPRSVGINLVWGGSPCRDGVSLHRDPFSSVAPLVVGERLALHVEGGGYLVHGERTFGINLEWSSTPSYEWKMVELARSEGEEGVGSALFNTREGDYLVHATRGAGVDLAWYKDTLAPPPPPPTQPVEVDETVFLEKYIPYVGYEWWTGIGHRQGKLVDVQVPDFIGEGGYFFLEYHAGLTSQACSQAAHRDVPGVGVFVRDGESMSASQKQALFGSATPLTPVPYFVCPALGNDPPDTLTLHTRVLHD